MASLVSETTNDITQEENNTTVEEQKDCGICYVSLNNTNTVITPCSHAFCNTCFFKWLGRKESCALCRRTLLTNEQVEERELLLDEINEDVARELSILNQTKRIHKRKKKQLEKIEKKANDLMDRQIRLREMLDRTRGLCINSMDEHEEIEMEISSKKTALRLMSSYRKEWAELYGKNEEKAEFQMSAREMKELIEKNYHRGRRRGRNIRIRPNGDLSESESKDLSESESKDLSESESKDLSESESNDNLGSFTSIETTLANIETEIERAHFNNNSTQPLENIVIDLTQSETEEKVQDQTAEESSGSTTSLDSLIENHELDINYSRSPSQSPLLAPPSPPDLSSQEYSSLSEEKTADPLDDFTLASTIPLPDDSIEQDAESKQNDENEENEESMFQTPPRANSTPRVPGAPLRINIPSEISNFIRLTQANNENTIEFNFTPSQQLPDNIFVFGAPENATSSPPPPQIRRRVVVRRNRNRINSRHRVSFHNDNEGESKESQQVTSTI